jgi:hypothetical protein
MGSETFLIFRRPFDPGKRLGMALLVSALLHALMLTSLSRYSIHGNAFTRPMYAPLSIRIARLPEARDAAAIVIDGKKASLPRKINAPKPVASSAPAEIAPSLPQPGVSVTDTLYLRPIPGRLSSTQLASGEFRRASDVSEKPETVSMGIPRYPRLAQEQKLSGWVIVVLLVDESGKVIDTAAVESSESFNDYEGEVAEELRGSIFTPGKLDGHAVKTLVFARVRFDSKGLSSLETTKGTTAPVPVENKEKR